jgi:hypothetical protein
MCFLCGTDWICTYHEMELSKGKHITVNVRCKAIVNETEAFHVGTVISLFSFITLQRAAHIHNGPLRFHNQLCHLIASSSGILIIAAKGQYLEAARSDICCRMKIFHVEKL